MGLIKAITESVSSSLGDLYKEFVVCPEIEKNVLVQRGEVKRGKGNKTYTDGVISNGSLIVVPQGMAMMIVDNGQIKEFTAESGEYKWDSSSEPSIFEGNLGDGIKDTIKNMTTRFTYGGMAAKDQRVYYVNLLTITGNKFGSPQPKPITDEKYGTLRVTFFGEYAFKVVDPVLLVKEVIGANAKDTVTFDEVLAGQLKMKFIEKLGVAISIVMRKLKVSIGDIAMYGSDISDAMNDELDEVWKNKYGLIVTDVALADINLTEDSFALVTKVDQAKIFSDASMQSGLLADATAESMKNASSNENGAMMGFMGMNMAQNTGAAVMGAVNQSVPADSSANESVNTNDSMKTEDNLNKQNFCPNCGAKVSTKFCTNCGTKQYD